jgi:hypothetical protein
MRTMVKKRLEGWTVEHRGALPNDMVFFRDGISGSQFAAYEKIEIAAVRAAYSDLCFW